MDKSNKRNEVERKAVKFIRDSGDIKKPVFGKTSIDKSFPPDRGDSNHKPVTQKSVNEKKRSEEKHNSYVKESTLKKDKSREVKVLDAKEKKTIREKYTLKLRSLNHNANGDLNKPNENHSKEVKATGNSNGDKRTQKAVKKSYNIEAEIPKVVESNSNNSGKTVTQKPEHEPPRRKPVIKTIMSKNDTLRIFKAVTFVDEKKKETPLKINIPDVGKKQSKIINTSVKAKVKKTVSRVSVKEKPVIKKTGKIRRVRRHMTSPDMSIGHRIRSPPTEVAKWAPTSVNRHTKPYYEAWVDTTLTAISKNYRKDQMFLDRKSIMKTFQQAFENRPLSPELMYEKLADEKFTGRIKVRQK